MTRISEVITITQGQVIQCGLTFDVGWFQPLSISIPTCQWKIATNSAITWPFLECKNMKNLTQNTQIKGWLGTGDSFQKKISGSKKSTKKKSIQRWMIFRLGIFVFPKTKNFRDPRNQHHLYIFFLQPATTTSTPKKRSENSKSWYNFLKKINILNPKNGWFVVDVSPFPFRLSGLSLGSMLTSWWFQPIWKKCSSKWVNIIFPQEDGVNIPKKYLSCHHRVDVLPSLKLTCKETPLKIEEVEDQNEPFWGRLA